MSANSPAERSIVDRCSSHTALAIARSGDLPFDPFPPPSVLYTGLPISAFFDCYREGFTVANRARTKSIAFPYAKASIALLRSLECGTVSGELHTVLGRLDVIYIEGAMIVKVTDYRFSPERNAFFRLKAANDAFLRAVGEVRAPPGGLLAAEASFLRLTRPAVCTDPSPNVARVMSALTFRRKLGGNMEMDWRPEKEEEQPHRMKVVRGLPEGIVLEPLGGPLHVPREMLRAFGIADGSSNGS
jgi:hypothetical protein